MNAGQRRLLIPLEITEPLRRNAGYELDVQLRRCDPIVVHRLPLRRPDTRIAGRRALLVGDAAGLLDPVSGDGMYECFVSARLATTAILDLLAGRAASLVGYQDAVDGELASLHGASWRLKCALDRWPRASWRLARSALVWRTVERLLLGDLGAPGEQRGIARVPLRALSLLGRS